MQIAVTQFSKKHISFPSGETRCSGYLYVPDAHGALPCIVLANGFTGTMDWNLPKYGERFAAAGFAALIFDYRYFGESEGEPRQLVDINKQREDLRNAVSFARNYEGIDASKIILWGTSLGGGHVVNEAAHDPAIATVIAQVPGIDMVNPKARATIKISVRMLLRILLAALRDMMRAKFGLSPHYIRVFSDTGETAVFTDTHLKPRFERLMKSKTTWINKFTPRFYFNLPRYKRGTAENIIMPLLVCIADKEVYANPKFQSWVAEQAPKGEIKHYDAEHFDFYDGVTFQQVVDDQIDFLRRHVV
jgi:dienelactone hydrolase